MEEEPKEPKEIKIKFRKPGLYQITTVVLAIVLVAMFAIGTCSITGAAVAPVGSPSADTEEVAQNTVTFLNENFGAVATMKTSTQVNGMHKLTLDVEGQETDVYVSPDGELVFPMVIDTTETPEAPTQPTEPEPVEMETSATPVVEAFVMSHCPYGTQIEKGLIPVVELLGDKIDFELKFVSYAMHGETEIYEQLNQYCIQKEFNDQFLDYLGCFLEEGDGEGCIAELGIDTAALEACTAAADEEFQITELFEDESTWSGGRFPQFNIHLTENQEYGVRGSPSLVVNGVSVQSGRDSASLLSTICSAFDEPPAECEEELSSASPSPGFGFETSGSETTATCG